MGKYKLTIKKSAAKELQTIPKVDYERIVDHIRSLGANPRVFGYEKLSLKEQYRIRQGNYRIVYSIDDKQLLVDIVKIGHRKEVYRK